MAGKTKDIENNVFPPASPSGTAPQSLHWHPSMQKLRGTKPVKDQDIIQDAYTQTVMDLYKNLFAAYVNAAGNAAEQKNADAAFKAGLALARNVRDQAIKQL